MSKLHFKHIRILLPHSPQTPNLFFPSPHPPPPHLLLYHHHFYYLSFHHYINKLFISEYSKFIDHIVKNFTYHVNNWFGTGINWESLEEMDKFLITYDQPILNQDNISHLNISKTSNEIEEAIKIL
jgi:hypothetical protein